MVTKLLLTLIVLGTALVSDSAECAVLPRSLKEARPNIVWVAATRLRADFDCDGQTDQAYLGSSKGRVYVGVLLSTRKAPQILEFAVGAGVQAAICDEPGTLKIEKLDDPSASVGEIEGFRKSKTCKGL